MTGTIRYLVLICCILILPSSAFSQVLVKASADKDSILIGEPLQITLYAHVPLGLAIRWFEVDSIPHFNITAKSRVDTTDDIDGKKIEQVITVTSFDSGTWNIPPLPLQAGLKQYFTENIRIGVNYMPFNPDEDYRDIRDIEDVASPSAGLIPWFIGAGALISLVAVAWLLSRKGRVRIISKPSSTSRSPYDEAMESLQALRQEGWAQNGQVKTYYTQLNDILRIFVLRKLQLATLEKTNDELILQLRQLNIPRDEFSRLAQTLRMTDSVKFARYQPASSDNEENWQVIASSIKILNNIS